MVAEFDTKFGLDKPLWQQYLTYMWDIAHLDFGFSMANYPRRVNDIMGEALPWTIALLGHLHRHRLQPRHLHGRHSGLAQDAASSSSTSCYPRF